MKAHTLIRISGMLLVAVVVSLAILALIYTFQHPQLPVTLASIAWN